MFRKKEKSGRKLRKFINKYLKTFNPNSTCRTIDGM